MRAIGFGLLFMSWAFVSHANQESVQLKELAHFNKYSKTGYNDCWGYTDPDGREYALLGVKSGTSIIDITDLKNIREVAFIGSKHSTWKDIKTYKNYAYVVNESGGGLQIIDLSGLPNSAKLVNTVTEYFTTSHNLYIDEENAVLYAEGNHSNSTRLLSLADPVHPLQLDTFGVETHDIYARNNMVYVSEGGHGTIGIFDANDPENVTLHGRFEIPRSGYVHNAWLSEDGDYLMTTEETNGKSVKYWDISDVNNVVMTSEYLAPSKLAHNAHIKGDYAYISHYGGGLRILDISDPHDIHEVAYFMEQDKEKRGFVDSWGAFPFFDSGKVLISDIDSGLYVVQFKSRTHCSAK
jgi:choice-of-anchor B domain-containing protein